MFGLDTSFTILLIICLLAAAIFEFINGFHDTANAVATVIYTNSLKPWVAVIWSGIWNSIGVFAGGIAVAMGITNLLPTEILLDTDISHNIALILSLLITAIFWNLGTWYYGIPCSSSHTLIGSILGVGIAFSLIADDTSIDYVNWGKAADIGLSLLFSPLLGFSIAILLMYVLRQVVKNRIIFKEPVSNAPPPFWIRLILLLTCTGVSFSHGSNDGQKGVGLVMLILIAIVPGYFTLDISKNTSDIKENVIEINSILAKINPEELTVDERFEYSKSINLLIDFQTYLGNGKSFIDYNNHEKMSIRKDLILLNKAIKLLLVSKNLNLSLTNKTKLKKSVDALKGTTEYAPVWVILMISISLGLGTMIGWKRIVKTIGEKIGKQHLTYAQGASAELVAATTIGFSTWLGLPVSTTHVLSSGVAGSMVASKGVKNLQSKTISTIAMAWLLTLPVCILVSGGLFLLFRWII
ncbi:MAG: inorganic phosphate transporter [Bacteroidota bacterium]|nr:inorganic phosphate transporter [Bacteroidota bacterium]